jgi:hypothetical protein
MRFDVKTWGELDRAAQEYREAEAATPLILVFHTPGDIAHRFIINNFGIEKQSCDKKGNPLNCVEC